MVQGLQSRLQAERPPTVKDNWPLLEKSWLSVFGLSGDSARLKKRLTVWLFSLVAFTSRLAFVFAGNVAVPV